MVNDQKINWGIVGLGNIAHKFVQDLLLIDDANVVACASRDGSNASNFASSYQIPYHYDNYQDVFNHPEVDIVYVATTHEKHCWLSISAMQAGKHVLCEKPLALNESQVTSMIAAAKENQVFLMEALWARFNPSIRAVRDLIENGTIGKLNYITADFTYARNDTDESRMLNLALAGGSLMDMGVYPLFLVYLLMGYPESIVSAARLHETGADIQTSAILSYPHGLANVMSGFRSESDMRAKIHGTLGRIELHAPWFKADGYSVILNEGTTSQIALPLHGHGYTYEIEECHQCIRDCNRESEKWSHQHSLDLIRMTDTIRQQCGLNYPDEHLS